jgi:hypothetical protein
MDVTFKRRDVDRAFRTFGDRARDLMQADQTTWEDALHRLLHHCENDPVMSVITYPLKAKPVNAAAWYQEALETVVAVSGSGRYRLPTDDEDCAALIYEFLQLVDIGKIDLMDFCVGVYGLTRPDDMVRAVNRELVTKFVREISYRLDEITQDIGDAKEVLKERMVVFQSHHHDHSTTIHGSVQGSVVATGGSMVEGSPATFSTSADLATALKSLKPIIKDVAETQRDAVQGALDVMIRGAEDDGVTIEDATTATGVIAAGSPTLWGRIKEIGWKVSAELGSLVVVQAIKSAAGIP